MFRLILFLFAFLFLLSPKLTHAQESPEYVIGVLRYDGIVEPFASMKNSTWKSISDHDLNYIAWKQPSFYFYTNSDSVEKLNIGTQVIFDPGGMNSGKGFISSFSNSSPGHNCCYPKPKAGLVLNWKTQQAKFVNSDSLHPSFHPQEANKIKQIFRSSEKEYVNKSHQYENDGKLYVYPGIPVSEESRDSLEIGIHHKITDQSFQGKRYLYFNAERDYPSTGCGSSFGKLKGWGMINNGRLKLIKHSYSVGDCDGKGLDAYIEPHIAFELQDKVYIGITLSYYEGEGRQLFEVSNDNLKPLLTNN